MEKLFKALKSRTVWTLFFAFIFNGFQAISGAFPPEQVIITNTLFSLLATLFKINPSQKY